MTDSLTIGIDVGGTKIAAGVVTAAGEERAHARHESPAANAGAIVTAIGELVAKLRTEADGEIVGVGVAAAGFVDKDRSNVLFAPNLAWRDEPLLEFACHEANYSLVHILEGARERERQ